MPDIIYEDNHLVVVIKPQNMPTQADESGDLDLLTDIKTYLASSGGKKGLAYCGLVHRLDRVTGGVMVFAKTSKSASRLCAQIKDGQFQKKYLCVTVGEPKQREGELVNYLLKNEKRNMVEVVPSASVGAKRAHLTYKVLQSRKSVSLLEVDLHTGRSHQVRVQLSHIGCPIFGDNRYGGTALAKGWNIALWAYELSFMHPTSGDMLRFIVNPPETTPWDKFEFARKSHQNVKSDNAQSEDSEDSQDSAQSEGGT